MSVFIRAQVAVEKITKMWGHIYMLQWVVNQILRTFISCSTFHLNDANKMQ